MDLQSRSSMDLGQLNKKITRQRMEKEQITQLEQEVKRLAELLQQKEKHMEQMDSTIMVLSARGANMLSISQVEDVTSHKQYIALQ